MPEGATNLIAMLCASTSDVAQAFAVLASTGLGCPSVAPPSGYVEMAAVGKKGEDAWHCTHAAADVALATGLVARPGKQVNFKI